MCSILNTYLDSSPAEHIRSSDQLTTARNSDFVFLASLQQTVIPTSNSNVSQNLCNFPTSSCTILCGPFKALSDKAQNFPALCHACPVFNTVCYRLSTIFCTSIQWQDYSAWTETWNNLPKRPVGCSNLRRGFEPLHCFPGLPPMPPMHLRLLALFPW
jgi:hypothetical protein